MNILSIGNSFRDISNIDFHEFDEEVTDAEIEIAKKCVNETLKLYI